VCLFAAAPNQRDTGRRGSIKLFKRELASTANNIKHGYEIAIRKDNKMIREVQEEIVFLWSFEEIRCSLFLFCICYYVK